MTDDELVVLYEKRERIRKKDIEEQAQTKGKKAPPAKKEDPKKAGKGAAPVEEKPKPVPTPDEEPTLNLPEPSQHVNSNIVEFLEHFKSDRLIQIEK